MAYPLGSAYHVAHGEANYQFFIPCFKHYMESRPVGAINEIAELFGQLLECPAETAFDRLQEVLSQLLPLKDLREYGMKEEECISFAESVLKNQQRLLVNSYVQFTQEEIEAVYRLRYEL